MRSRLCSEAARAVGRRLCAWLHVHVWTLHAECGDVWWLSDRQILDGDGLCQLHVVRGRWAESCCCKQYCALHAVLSCGRKRDSSAGVRHTKVMASCMRSEAERPRRVDDAYRGWQATTRMSTVLPFAVSARRTLLRRLKERPAFVTRDTGTSKIAPT